MTENDPGYPGWRVTIAAAFGVFISFASVVVYTFGVFLKPLTEAFAWSREAVSVAFGISAMTVAVCSPPLGWLLDRFSPRRIILPSVAIFGISFASLGWLTPHLWHLYAVFFVIGIVANGTAQMAYSRAVSTWFDRRRGMAFALLMTGGAVGAIVLPRVTQWIIGSAGWRTAFVVMGSSVLLFGLPVIAFMIREHPASRSHDSTSRAGATVRDALRSRAFWLIVASLFLVSLGQNSAITHMPALLSDRGRNRWRSCDGALHPRRRQPCRENRYRLATGPVSCAPCLLDAACLGRCRVYSFSRTHNPLGKAALPPLL